MQNNGTVAGSSDRHQFNVDDDDVPPLASYTDDVMAAHTPRRAITSYTTIARVQNRY